MAKEMYQRDQTRVLGLVAEGKKALTEEIFEALYEEVKPVLYANRWRVPKNILENDDYYQEARMCLMQAVDGYKLDSKALFTTYFSNVFKNRLLDIRRMHMTDKRIANYKIDRKMQLFQTESDDNSLENFLQTNEFPPDHAFLFKESITRYEDSLSEMERKAFEYFKAGLSYTEMSELAGLSKKQLQSLISKCKQKYKKILSDLFD
ncbi:sigma-70 family RNA polymerase sigma factor [Aerococcus agrisoli]|uniref:Sigma-70 family RNA polymerase sigma factor n=1 Tax=Aerococcus agrisoli TaxID=2487350 RepID=A0A3N4GPD6_9LACT|nr:sigma-70 family RNA polymerase sigma factor [Aerococcus agrisoli]RPA60951.1 sigma-70 family RNA polymerase sigma factor [Aerococcus agrisoli]